MNELEEKTEDVPMDAVEDGHAGEQKAEEDSGLGMGVIFFLIAFTVCFLASWLLFPKVLYSKKSQPFNFNHRLHVEEVGDCQTCHFFRDDGTFSGIPKTSKCLECHDGQIGDTKDEAIFVNKYASKDKEVPWFIYSKQPNCVFFSHAAHVKAAGMDCKTCHGDIGDSTKCKPYEVNRITGYSRDIYGKNIWGIEKHTWDSMKMDDCAKCHEKETGEKGSCFQCHK